MTTIHELANAALAALDATAREATEDEFERRANPATVAPAWEDDPEPDRGVLALLWLDWTTQGREDFDATISTHGSDTTLTVVGGEIDAETLDAIEDAGFRRDYALSSGGAIVYSRSRSRAGEEVDELD